MCMLKAEQLCNKQPVKAADSEHQESTKPVTSSASVNSSCNDVTSRVSVSSSSQSVVSSAPPRPALPRCPYRVIEICNTCWTRSNSKDVIGKSSKANQCSKVGHPWIGVSFLILPCKKLLAHLPPTIPRNLNFSICWDIMAKQKRCRRGGCTFAHCEEEMAIWKWMVQNNGEL